MKGHKNEWDHIPKMTMILCYIARELVPQCEVIINSINFNKQHKGLLHIYEPVTHTITKLQI